MSEVENRLQPLRAEESYDVNDLLSAPEYTQLPSTSGLLTTLRSDEDQALPSACVTWHESARSTGDSSDGSRLSTFSMHLARSDLAYTFSIGRQLGEGASAEVFEATDLNTGAHVAIKVFSDNKPETIHAACAEFVCAMRSASAHALAYYEVAFMRGRPALVMELGDKALDAWIREHKYGGPASKPSDDDESDTGSESSWGSQSTTSSAALAKSQQRARGTSVTESTRSAWHTPARGPTQLDIMSIMLGILEGLMQMHAAGLAHLDLKPGNVILVDSMTAKLADFGAACAIDHRTGRLAVGRSGTRDDKLESLVLCMETKLACAPDRRVSQTEADRLAAHEMPQLDAEEDDGGEPDVGLPGRLRTRFQSTSLTRPRSSSKKAAVPVRGRTLSGAEPEAVMRPPAYSLREVPMFTCSYSSPERSNTCDQRKVDVWAAGCILYELCVGTPFIQANTQRDRFVAMAQFYNDTWQPPRLPPLMSCWQPLLDAMMARDADARLLPADLLAFPIFLNMRARRSFAYHASARGLQAFRSMRTAVSSPGGDAGRSNGALTTRPSAIDSDLSCVSDDMTNSVGTGSSQAKRVTMSGGDMPRRSQRLPGQGPSLDSSGSSGVIGAMYTARWRVSV